MAKQGFFTAKSWWSKQNQQYDDWDDWEQGGKDTAPPDNKGKMGYMPLGWTEEQRKKVDHVICPTCAATVYASGYMERDKCDVCWAPLPKHMHMERSAEAAKNNKSSQGTHSKYSGSYSKSLTSFAKQSRSKVEVTNNKKEHLLSTIDMVSMPDNYWFDNQVSNYNSGTEGIREQTKHSTKQHKGATTNADEYLSSTSEAYAHTIAQEIELYARALELSISSEDSNKHIDLRRLIEIAMGEFGAATGHKIGDDWFLRDTTDEAKAIQDRAGYLLDQPMYGAALYGDEGTGAVSSKSKASVRISHDQGEYHPHSAEAKDLAREQIRQGIKEANIQKELEEVSSEVDMAKPEDRMAIMQEKLTPLMHQIINVNGGELDPDKANEAIKEAESGFDENKNRAEVAERGEDEADGSNEGKYKTRLRDYMNGVGDEIRKEREALAAKKSREDKWSNTAKNIANAYGHDANSGYSVFDTTEPLYEFSSNAPKTVPLSFKAQQMLEAIESERRVTWEESGETTDRMVELNFGNLKVFRKEDTYSPQLLIGVDVSGSTDHICSAGIGEKADGYFHAGDLMWEIAATISSAATENNTHQFAYHSTEQGFLTTIDVPRGMRPQCRCESRNEYYGTRQADAEHGGGTPELAMLHYLNDKAQAQGDLSSTTAILIVDGQPDDPTACKKMSEELVKAGVQFGVVVVGSSPYTIGASDYYSSSVSVKVKNRGDIDQAIPRLMSLIRERGLA